MMRFIKHKMMIFPFEWADVPHLWVLIPPSVQSVGEYEQTVKSTEPTEPVDKNRMISARLSYEMVAIDVTADELQPLFAKEDADGVTQLVNQCLLAGRTKRLTPEEINRKMPYTECLRAMNAVVAMINGPRLTQTAEAAAAAAQKAADTPQGESLSG